MNVEAKSDNGEPSKNEAPELPDDETMKIE
jgi:hypothetical protein